MTLLPQNPFLPTKIEHDQDPVFWLSSHARQLSKTYKHAFVSGSRGSGKTTLLRSLRTADIKGNGSLRSQYSRNTFDWFGVYLQFNKTLQTINSESSAALLTYLSRTPNPSAANPESVRLRVFQTYLELTIFLAFLEDLIKISDRKEVSLSSVLEKRICAEVAFRIEDKSGELQHKDIYGLKATFERCRSLFSAIPTEETLPRLVSLINSFTPGELLGYMSELIGGLRGSLVPKKGELKPIILIDDCESLTEDQQISLNTTLKQFEGRIKFIISFIEGQYNRNLTLLPNTVLKNDDFEAVKLDEESRENFILFCERVTRLRLRHFYEGAVTNPRRPLPEFSLEKTLGTFSVNELLASLVTTSISESVQAWSGEVEKTKAILRQVITKRNWQKFSVSDNQMPYVEHTIMEAMDIDPFTLVKEIKQNTLAKVIDRKNFAAMVYCAREKIKSRTVPYAGRDIVIQLATGCIRDYLDIMAAIYDTAIAAIDSTWKETKEPRISHLTYFADPDRPVSIERQRAAIYSASGAKWEVLRRFTVKSSFDVIQVISGLGALVVQLQKPAEAYKSVSQSERGLFVIDVGQLDRALTIRKAEFRTSEVFRTLQRDGFIRLVSSPDDKDHREAKSQRLIFHLHRRLHPELGLSPRGPYERVTLNASRFASLLLDPNVDPERWAAEMLPNVNNEAIQGEIGL
jgi:DNA polymerase III delta prime subunit